MPGQPFIIDFTKQHQLSLQKWGNRYLVQASDLTEANTAVDALLELEQAVHQATVDILQARVSTVTASDDEFLTHPLSAVGTLGFTGPVMPMITTLNIEVVVLGFGRPSRKYYHPCVGNSAMHLTLFQNWDEDLVSDVHTAVQDAITACSTNGTPLIDPDGQLWSSAVIVQKTFGFHQFHKRSPRQPS